MPTMEESFRPHSGIAPHAIASGSASASASANQCAGCNAKDVPLLACDDIDGSGNVADPSQRARFCPNCMIGKKVRVFWPVDSSWYIGTVQQFDEQTGEHLLQYDDEDTEWVKIGEDNTTASPMTMTAPSQPPINHLQTATPSTSATASSSMQGVPSVTPSGHPPINTDHPNIRPPYHPEHHHPGITPDRRELETPRRHPEHPPPPHFYSPQRGGGGGGEDFQSYQGYPGYGPPGPYAYPPTGAGPYSHHIAHRKDMLSAAAANKKKQGPKAWTKEEDSLLLSIVQTMRMPLKWSIVAQSLPDRTGKQCRERYVNHLNPRLKNTDWDPIEDATVFHLYDTIGSHWAKMSKIIPGRTDNGIKNRFHNLRRQLEREDEHRTRLRTGRDFPQEIRLDRLREIPEDIRGRSSDLWDFKAGISILAAQTTLGSTLSRHSGRFGPFRKAEEDDVCSRCGFMLPSLQTGNEICTKSGWCQSCTRVPPHLSGCVLRECLDLRRSQDPEQRMVIESWPEPVREADSESSSGSELQ